MSSLLHRPLLLVFTHGAALALGLVLFKSFAASGGSATAAVVSREDPAGEVETSPAESSASRNHARPRENGVKRPVYASAWKSLAYENLPRPERMKASAVILRDWIREDWHAALDTVMRETPDDFVLLDEFHTTFAREPEAVSRLIQEKRYGVLTKMLLDHWTQALSSQDEATLRRLADSPSGPIKDAALEAMRLKASVTPP
jgi:hypothetical protein